MARKERLFSTGVNDPPVHGNCPRGLGKIETFELGLRCKDCGHFFSYGTDIEVNPPYINYLMPQTEG